MSKIVLFLLLLDDDLLEGRRRDLGRLEWESLPKPPYPRAAAELFDRPEEEIRGARSSSRPCSSSSLSFLELFGLSEEVNGFWYCGRYEGLSYIDPIPNALCPITEDLRGRILCCSLCTSQPSPDSIANIPTYGPTKLRSQC